MLVIDVWIYNCIQFTVWIWEATVTDSLLLCYLIGCLNSWFYTSLCTAILLLRYLIARHTSMLYTPYCIDSMLFWYCLSAQFHTYIMYMTCSIANQSYTIYICWSHDSVCCLSLHTFHSYILWLSAPCSRSVDVGLVDCAMTAGSVVCTIMYTIMYKFM